VINTSSVTDKEAHELFRRALRDLMLRFPLCGLSYLGAAVEVREERGCQTMATDGRIVWYDPEWMHKCDERGRVFDTLHEWLHIFFNHVARMGDRDRKLWNTACDIVVVREACRILSKQNDTWLPPEDGVQPPLWADAMTAEEIYEELKRDPARIPKIPANTSGTQRPGAQQTPDPRPGTRQPSDFREGQHTEVQEANFRHQFTKELAQAAFVQQQISRKTPEELWGSLVSSRLEEVLRGKEPWGRLLRGNLLTAMGDEFPSYAPPSLRYYPEIILPRMLSRTEKTLLIAVDDSASIGTALHKEFVANVMPAALRAKTVHVLTFDAIIREHIVTTKPRKVLDALKFETGFHSHTDVRPVFELADKIKPTATVIFTDGLVVLPTKPYPKTLWVLPQNGIKPPWGRYHRMEVSW
jgi:hypothetical protein